MEKIWKVKEVCRRERGGSERSISGSYEEPVGKNNM